MPFCWSKVIQLVFFVWSDRLRPLLQLLELQSCSPAHVIFVSCFCCLVSMLGNICLWSTVISLSDCHLGGRTSTWRLSELWWKRSKIMTRRRSFYWCKQHRRCEVNRKWFVPWSNEKPRNLGPLWRGGKFQIQNSLWWHFFHENESQQGLRVSGFGALGGLVVGWWVAERLWGELREGSRNLWESWIGFW